MAFNIQEYMERMREDRRKRMEQQKQQKAQAPASTPSMQKSQEQAAPEIVRPKPRTITQDAVKTPSLADNLWFHGVNILKTDDENYRADERAQKTKKGQKPKERPMLRNVDVEYLRDPATGTIKPEDNITLTDIYRALRQVPPDERGVVNELFEQNYLKKRSSPYYDPYYSTRSNNTAAMKLWGTDDLTSVVTDPANLKYLDYIVPNKNGQTPKAPTKKSSLNEQKGYSLYYLLQDHADEMAAKGSLPKLQAELGELAKAYPEMSEQEILDTFDWNMLDDNGDKSFKAINQYRDHAANYMEKYTVGGGLFVGNESLKAVIRAARRGEDVSELKDYIQSDADQGIWQTMTDEETARRPVGDKSAQDSKGGIIEWIGEKANEAERIGRAGGSLAGKALHAAVPGVADALRRFSIFPDPTQEQILAQEQKRLETALNQSVQTTGKIDLRDPGIPEDQWDFLIEAGLASADQRDAILAQRGEAQSAPEYTGMTPGAFNAQSTGIDRSSMSVQELADYKGTLTQQLAELERNEQTNAVQLPAIEAEIFKLENDLANGADPDMTNEKLQELYQQRDALVGSADNQAARQAAALRLQSEIDNINEGIATLRSESIRREKDARIAEEQKQAEKDRTARLLTADIDALAGEISMLETDGRKAQAKYAELTARMEELKRERDQLLVWEGEDGPTYANLTNEINATLEERNALDLANPGINLESVSALNTSVMRKKEDVLEATRLQYTALPVLAPDYQAFATKGMALKNNASVALISIGDPKISGIENPATFAQDSADTIIKWTCMVEGNGQVPGNVQKLFDMTFMEDGEVQLYSYLLANPKYGPDKADLFFESIRDGLRYRHGEQIAKPMMGNPWTSIPFGFAVGMDQHVQGLAQAFHPNKILPTSALQYAGWNLEQGLDELKTKLPDWMGGGSLAKGVYQLSSAFGGMVPTAIMNAFIPGSGPYELWVSAGGNSYNQSLREGHTQDEAMRYGVVRGGMEAYLESALGMMATGGGKLTSAAFEKASSAMRGPIADFALRVGASMVSNGTEEYLQDVLDTTVQSFAYNEEYKNLDWSDPEAIYSGLIGALMGAIGDSPEIASQIFGTSAIGMDFNNADDIALLLEAGNLAPEGSDARADTEAAMRRIESGKTLGDYRLGKLAESVGPERVFEAALGMERDAAAEEADQPSMQTEPAPEAAPVSEAPDVELSAEDIQEADTLARRVAYAISRDVKSFAPGMQRLAARVEALGTRMLDVLQKQIAAGRKADDLKRANGTILTQIASGETDTDTGMKQVQKNVQEGAAASTEYEQSKAEYAKLSDEATDAQRDLWQAQGEVYQTEYQRALAENMEAARQRMRDRQAAAKAAQLEEADRQASVQRVAEIDAQTQELDATDAQLATSEEAAKRTAQAALDAETEVLNAIGENPDAAEQAEQASMKARAAYDRYQAVQKQRQQVQEQREALAKERAELTNKINEQSAAAKEQQLERSQLVPADRDKVNVEQNQAERAKQTAPQDEADAQTSAQNVEMAQEAEGQRENESKRAQQNAPQDVADGMETPADKIKRLLKTRFPHTQIDPKTLKVDPDTYQFRSGADKSGVTKPMQGEYSPLYSDDIVVHRRLNGDMYVADGHHRTEFAVRQGVPFVDVIILDEAAGITAKDARLLAAARNMSQNHGEPLDAAKIFRDAEIKIQDLAELGLTATNSVIERGIALAQLSNEYWKRAISGSIDEFTGYVMGKHFPLNEKMQAAFMQFLGQRGGKKLSNAAQEELANILGKAQEVNAPDKQFAFDFFENFDSNALQIAELAARVKGKLARAYGLFKSLSNENKQAIIESVGQNRIDAEANDAKAGNISIAESLMENYATKGKVHDIINHLAKDIAEKRITLEKAAEQAKDEIIKLAQKGGLVIGGIDTQGSVPTVKGDRQANSGAQREGTGGQETQGGAQQGEVDTGASMMQPTAAAYAYPTRANDQTPQRVSKTAKDLYRAMGVRATSKHKPAILQKIAQGLYEHHSGVVVTKTHQDVNVYAHELGHAIFERAGVFDKQGRPVAAFDADINAMVQALPAAFTSLYKPNELAREAAGYFMNLYLLNRDQAINFAGEDFVNRFETQMLSKSQLKAMAKARQGFNDALAADVVEVMRARVVSRKDVKPERVPFWRNTIQKFADKYHSAMMFDLDALRKGYKFDGDGARLYNVLSNITRSWGRAEALFDVGLFTPDNRFVGKSFAEAVSGLDAKNRSDFELYALALHDIDRQRLAKPVFGDYTQADAANTASTLLAAHPEFQQIHQSLMDWWNAFIDEWVVKPNTIENAAQKIQQMRADYPNYVPTVRMLNDSMDIIHEALGDMGGMLGRAAQHFKKAKGGDQAIFSPLESMRVRATEIVAAAEKALGMRRFYEILRDTKGMGDWGRIIEGATQENDNLVKAIDAAGDAHYIQISDRLFHDMLFADGGPLLDETNSVILKTIAKASDAFKQLVTVLKPEFVVRNMLRDMGEAAAKSSTLNPVKFAADWAKAMAELTAAALPGGKMTDSVKAFYAGGNRGTGFTQKSRQGILSWETATFAGTFADTLQKAFTSDSFMERLRASMDASKMVRHASYETLTALSDIVEGSQRLAEFKRVYEATGDFVAANRAAAEVTLDFQRVGGSKVMRAVNKYGFVFANPAIQSAYSLVKIAQERPFNPKKFNKIAVKSAILFAANGIVQAMLRSLFMDDEDKEAYDRLPENVKSENGIWPKSWFGIKADGDNRFFQIPMLYTPIAQIGDMAGRALVEALQKEGNWDAFVDYGMKDWFTEGLSGIASSLNPYGSPIFAPILQIALNHPWYSSTDYIEPLYMRDKGISPQNRVKESTSSVAIWLTDKLHVGRWVSPIQMQYFVNQSFGVLGNYAMGDVGEAALAKLQGRDTDYKVGQTTANRLKRAISTDPAITSSVTSEIYDSIDFMEGIVNDAKTGRDKYFRLHPDLTEPEQKQAVNEAKRLIAKNGLLTVAKNRTARYFDEIDKVQAGSMPDSEKEKRIFDIRWKIVKENGATLDKIERDFIRKYITGTPAIHKKFYK